ncbi:hypothetical protein OKJ48_30200 [Streptomyces kunmingensis]|uniref:IS1 family transposase n=1 Tax=Streptomyces kunmingensis TaxID=68225 RepID=A0ABU6CJB5_9ACTN|nr:hypothetical protein [Streptomyces kunmingensis]MEB3964470.1 hypothetical protein [Streptomyces kunmingensis]
MPLSIIEEADRLLGVTVSPAEFPSPSPSSGAVPLVMDVPLTCPSCGSFHVAQMLGDNGGISYVCTACGHSWS